MRARRSLSLLVATVAVSTVGLVACGDDSSSSGAGSATTAAGGSATTAKPSGGGSANSGKVASDFVGAVSAAAGGNCAKAGAIADVMNNIDPTKGGNLFTDMAKAFEQIGSSGPSEIKADFATLAKGLAQFAKVFENVDLSDPAKLAQIMSDPAKAAEMEKAMSAIDDKEMTAASDRIEKWFEQKCPGLTSTTAAKS
jgi:hypothetical protein